MDALLWFTLPYGPMSEDNVLATATDCVIEWALSAWDYFVAALHAIYNLLHLTTDGFRYIIDFHVALWKAMLREFVQLLNDHLPSLVLCGYRITISIVAFCHNSISRVASVLDSVFRSILDFIYPYFCQDVIIPKSSSWSFFSFPAQSAESYNEDKRDCAYRVSAAVAGTAFATIVFLVVVVVLALRRKEEKLRVGVERGTNTPWFGNADRQGSPVNRGDGPEVSNEQFRELREHLTKVSRLIESQLGDDSDKDARIAELSFENRALRQNAIDEKELQSCIVCRAEPRRIVLFPCRHLCLCEKCSDHQFRHCPYCRTRCTRWEKIYV